MTNLDQRLNAILHTPGHELSGLAALVIRGGVVAYEGYFGRRRIDPENPASDFPVTAQTRFRVASISKMAVAVAVMGLAESGRLDLDGDISDHLGFSARNPNFPDQPITVRMLLSHTSSLRDGRLGYSLPLPLTLSAFFEPGSEFYQDGSHFAPAGEPPGGWFAYCNLNFGVLGTLLERVSGQRFDVYMREALLEPLGLGASFNVRDFLPPDLHDLAALYRKRQGEVWNPGGDWVPQVDDYRGQPPGPPRVENPGAGDPHRRSFTLDDYAVGSNGTLFSPQGGLRASARELSRLMLLLMNGGELGGVRLLRPQTVQEMLSPQWTYDPQAPNGDAYNGLFRRWTLGLQRFTHAADALGGDRLLRGVPLRWAGHLGDAYGLLGGFLFDPEGRNGMIYLIGGVGSDQAAYPGEYSSFARWEEQIITALYEEVLGA